MSRSASVSWGFLRACCGDPRTLLLGVALLCTLASAAHGGIALISQDRFVNVVDDIGRDQHQAAADFGPFNGSVDLIGGSAAQISSLTVTPGGGGAEFSDLMFISSPAINQGDVLSVQESLFQVNFEVSGAAVPFHVSYSSRMAFENLIGPTGSFTGSSAPGTLADGDVIDGVLQPGAYQLRADSTTDGTIQVDLQLGTSAVPLPPAVWAAMTLLPLVLLRRRVLPAALWEVLSALPVVLLGLWVATQKRNIVRRSAWFTRRR